jgi:hypothetical protein
MSCHTAERRQEDGGHQAAGKTSQEHRQHYCLSGSAARVSFRNPTCRLARLPSVTILVQVQALVDYFLRNLGYLFATPPVGWPDSLQSPS